MSAAALRARRLWPENFRVDVDEACSEPITAMQHTTSSTAKHRPTRRSVSAATSSASLAAPIQSTIPSCAQTCLSEYINQQFTCSESDFPCLCSHYSSQGYTLGELAFICVDIDCSNATKQEEVQAYGLCAAQPSKVPATHSVLMVPATTTTTTSSRPALSVTTTTVRITATSTAASSSAPSPTLASTTSATSTLTASKVSSTTSSPTSSETPSSDPSTAPATAGHTTSNHLTSTQGIGIGVGVAGAVLIALIIAFCIICRRRRKRKKLKKERGSYDFLDKAPAQPSPLPSGYNSAETVGPPSAPPRLQIPSEDWRRRSSYIIRDHALPARRPLNGKPKPSLVVKNTTRNPGELGSRDSLRIWSLLLPEKPHSALMRSGPEPTMSPPQQYEHQEPAETRPLGPVQESQKGLPELPRMPPPTRTMPGRQAAPPQDGGYDTTVSKTQQAPVRPVQVPIQATKISARSPPVSNIAVPPVPRGTSLDVPSKDLRAKSQTSSVGGSILAYYSSPDAGTPPTYAYVPPTPIDPSVQTRAAVPAAITINKPLQPRRAIRLNSTGSDTSFESTDPDEPTPPEADDDKQLSAEADGDTSPIAAVRYPKVPRSSNQAVPRSPGAEKLLRGGVADDRAVLPSLRQRYAGDEHDGRKRSPHTPQQRAAHTPTLSGSTLATANGLTENGRLRIDTTHIRAYSRDAKDGVQNFRREPQRHAWDKSHDSPLKGYGRTARLTQQRGLRPGVRVPMEVRGQQHQQQQAQQRRHPDQGTRRARDVSDSIAAQEVVLKSPLWEPKLTPRREGEDLFLEVGQATPVHAGFARGVQGRVV